MWVQQRDGGRKEGLDLTFQVTEDPRSRLGNGPDLKRLSVPVRGSGEKSVDPPSRDGPLRSGEDGPKGRVEVNRRPDG